MSDVNVQYLKRENGPRLAYIHTPAQGDGAAMPTVMFCGGFKSDMMGTKAEYFEEKCRLCGQAYIRFDYSGHGFSDGAFVDGTIGSWFQDALDIFDSVVNGPVILVGSSMGGWIGLLLAKRREELVKGFVGIAAAPDFTVRLYNEELDEDQRKRVQRSGFVEIPNDYSDDPYIFTKTLFEDGEQHVLLDRDHVHEYPIRLFQGLKDDAVPKEVSLAIQARFSGSDLDVVFIEDGDHRLSRSQDLEMIMSAIEEMSGP